MFASRRLMKSVTEVTSPYTVRKNGDTWLRSVIKTPFVSGITKEGQAYIDTNPNGSNSHTLEFGFDGKSVHSEMSLQHPDRLNKINKDKKVTVVLAHGYALGSGMWSPTIDALAADPRVGRVIAFDWRAMGGSARDNSPSRHWTYALMPQSIATMQSPTVSRVTSMVDNLASQTKTHHSPSQTVNYFLEYLPPLYKQLKLTDTPVTFVGHSLGGYLGCCFALKYPHLVQNLILASPVGVPYGLNSILSSKDTYVSNREIYQFAQFLNVPYPQQELLLTQTKDLQPYIKQLPLQLHSNTLLKMLMFCWNMGMSHKSVLKLMPTTTVDKLARGMSVRIFGDTFQSTEFSTYMHSLLTVPTAGENALNALLCMDYNMETVTRVSKIPITEDSRQIFPSVFARVPLAPFLHDLQMPTEVIYGDSDWLHQDGVQDVIKNQARGKIQATVLPDAGHHQYSNNPTGFNHTILSSVKTYVDSELYNMYNANLTEQLLDQSLSPKEIIPKPQTPRSAIHTNIMNLIRKKNKPTQVETSALNTDPTTLLPTQDVKKRKCKYSAILYGKFFNHPTKQ